MKSIFILLMVCWSVVFLNAEVLVFKDQSTLEGSVLQKEKEKIVFRVFDLSLVVFDTQVEKIEKSSPLQPQEREQLDRLFKNRSAKKIQAELKKFGPRAISFLEDRVREKHKSLDTKRVLSVLAFWKNDACLPLLTHYLENEDWTIRKQAMEILEEIGRLSAAHVAVHYLLNPSKLDAEAACGSLKRLHEAYPKSNIPYLLRNHANRISKWGKNEYPLIRAMGEACDVKTLNLLEQLAQKKELLPFVVRAIENVKVPEALDTLESLMKKDISFQFPEIFLAMGRSGGTRAVPLLLEVWENEKIPEVSRNCRLALQEISGARFGEDLAMWKNWWESRQNRLNELQSCYDDLEGDDETALAALKKLRAMGERECLPKVLPLLQNASSPVKVEVCLLVYELGDSANVTAILPLLQGEEQQVVAQAHRTLQKISRWQLPAEYDTWKRWHDAWRDKKSEGLVELLGHPSHALRQMALQELRKRQERGVVSKFIESLADWSEVKPMTREDVRLLCALILVLSEFQSEEAVPMLIDQLKSPLKGVQYSAYNALKSITGQSLPLDPQAWESWASEE